MTEPQRGPRGPRAAATPIPTMRDVADHLGVSRQLVSMVLRGADGPSADSRERILTAARDLGYRPNASARLLKRTSTKLIGVLFQIRNPFQARFVEQLLVRAAAAGYGLALEPVTEERTTDTVVAELMEQRVEAIIAFNPEQASSVLHEAVERMPVVLLGEWASVDGVDNVHVDEEQGLLQAVEHLIALGHQRIAYVGGIGADLGPERAEAYRAAMRVVGLDDRIAVVPSDFSEEGGADAARSVLAMDHRPSALLCCGDQCATGVLAVFSRAGIAVPDDVSVVGFDDSYLASLSYQQLTSVHQDVEATVEAAMARVLARLSGDDAPAERVATPTRLVVRSSTGAPTR